MAVAFFLPFVAQATPNNEVKACYECKGADACRPERLGGSEIRSSSVFGAKNLYCYMVRRITPNLTSCHWRIIIGYLYCMDRNSIRRLAILSLVVLLDFAKHSTNLLSAMLTLTYVAILRVRGGVRVCGVSRWGWEGVRVRVSASASARVRVKVSVWGYEDVWVDVGVRVWLCLYWCELTIVCVYVAVDEIISFVWFYVLFWFVGVFWFYLKEMNE